VIALLAWVDLASCSPSHTVAVAAGTPSGGSEPESVSPCTEGNFEKPEQGVAACTDALAAPGLVDGRRARFFNARGEYYCSTAQYDLAIADQSEAIRLKPGFAQAYMDRGGCYVGKRDLKAALADYDEGIRLAPARLGAIRFEPTSGSGWGTLTARSPITIR
jgi:lipoprotein NlpI